MFADSSEAKISYKMLKERIEFNEGKIQEKQELDKLVEEEINVSKRKASRYR